jgi:hypothetical protein
MVTTFGTPDKPSCKRQMAFNYLVDGMKQPPSVAQLRGIELHDTLEKIAKVNQGDRPAFAIPKEHQIYVNEVEAQGHLPAPGENALIEHWMTMPTQFGIPFVGKIDLVRHQIKPPRLIDYKTTSDVRYMLTPAEVHEDVQTNVYAHYLFEEGLQEPLIGGLLYIEMPKTLPKKVKVKVIPRLIDLTRRQSTAVWDRIQPVLEEILEVAELDHPNDVEPNTAICTKYGGCPYRNECGLSMFAAVATHPTKKKETPTMSFLDKLKNNGHTAEAPAKAAPVPVVKTAAPAAAPKAKAAFLGAKAAPAPTPVVEAAAPAPEIFSPDAPDLAAGGVQEQTEAPRRAGRPKGSTNAAKAAARGLTIYLDCMMTKGGGDVEATSLEDWWGPIEMELNEAATESGKTSWWEFSFAEQKAAISMKVQERIQRGLPQEIIVRQSSRFLVSDVLPLLIPHATSVITRI